MENAERTSREITLFSNVQSGFFKRIPTMRRAIDSHKTYLSSSVILLLLSPLARTKFLKHIIEHLFLFVNVHYIQKYFCNFYCVPKFTHRHILNKKLPVRFWTIGQGVTGIEHVGVFSYQRLLYHISLTLSRR